jgi:hypothetical protein
MQGLINGCVEHMNPQTMVTFSGINRSGYHHLNLGICVIERNRPNFSAEEGSASWF